MAGNNNNIHQKDSYTKKFDALKAIYYSHSKHGQRDKDILRMSTQVDIDLPRRPPTSKVNPWLVQPKEDTVSFDVIEQGLHHTMWFYFLEC
jgi:hypothetical protein